MGRPARRRSEEPQRCKRVVGHLARPDEVPKSVEHGLLVAASTRRIEVAEERGASRTHVLAQAHMQLLNRCVSRIRHETRCVAAKVKSDAPIGGSQRASAHPDHLTHRHQLIEEPRVISADSARDDVALDHGRRQGRTLKLEDDFKQAVDATRAGADAVPGGQESCERFGRDRFDFASQRRERTPAQHAQYLGVAELTSTRGGVKLAGDDIAARDEPGEGTIDGRAREVPPSDDMRGDEWDMGPCPTPKQRDERLGTGFEVGIGQPNRQRYPKRLSVSAGVLCRNPSRLAGDA